MRKRSNSFFEKLGSLAQVMGEISKATDTRRQQRDPNGGPVTFEDIAEGISETFDAKIKAQDPERYNRRKEKEHSRRGFEKVEPHLMEIVRSVTEVYDAKNKALLDELAQHLATLTQTSALNLQTAPAFFLLDREVSFDYFRKVDRRIDDQVELFNSSLAQAREDCSRVARDAAAQFDQSLSEKWFKRGQDFPAYPMLERQWEIMKLKALRDQLERRLSEARSKLDGPNHDTQPVGFDPTRSVISQLRISMPLSRSNLDLMIMMLNEQWTDRHFALFTMPQNKVFELVKQWKLNGLSDFTIDDVLVLFERSVIAAALYDRQVNIFRPFNDRFSEGNGWTNILAKFLFSSQLLEALPPLPKLTSDDQVDRFIDAIVLAGECKSHPTGAPRLNELIDAVVLPSTNHASGSWRLKHYAQLISRLEASATKVIGRKPSTTKDTSAFDVTHLNLLQKLRSAIKLDQPSAALIAWERHLASRHDTRIALVSKVSSFWRPLLEALLDRVPVTTGNIDDDDRRAFDGLRQIDELGRRIILDEVQAMLGQFDDEAFALASKVDCMATTLTIPTSQQARNRFVRLAGMLAMNAQERGFYFDPGGIGGVEDQSGKCFEKLRPNDDYFKTGPFGLALSSRQFEKAEALIHSWLVDLPAIPITIAMHEFDLKTLSISDWSVFTSLLSEASPAVIGLDFSWHAFSDLNSANATIPFEIGCYSPSAFKDSNVDVESLQAQAHAFPWQGGFDDLLIGLNIEGLLPFMLKLREFENGAKKSWPSDAVFIHKTIIRLSEAFIFLQVNRLVARELAKRQFPRSVPVIVGTHDFGNFCPVVHATR